MTTFEIILLGAALAMDAFAVSVTEGLKMERVRYKEAAIIALFFGAFQAAMPILGWKLGAVVSGRIDAYDHWIAFALLVSIGLKTLIDAIRDKDDGVDATRLEAVHGDRAVDAPSVELDHEAEAQLSDETLLERIEGEIKEYKLNIPEIFLLAIATSIDALAVGITFSLGYALNVPRAALLIGIVTFAICCGGVSIGRTFGTRYKRKAEIAGGLILIAIGLRILLDGLGLFL